MVNIIVPNDRPLVRTFVGTETVRGTAVAPNAKWYADMRLNRTQALAERPSYAGHWFGDTNPVRGAVQVAGNFSAFCTYEDIADYLRYLVVGGGTGVGDAGSPEAFTYTQRPSAETDDLDTFSAEYNFPKMPMECAMAFFTEGTIRCDIDDPAAVWMFDAPSVLARSLDYIDIEEHTAAGTHSSSTVQTTASSFTADEYNGGTIWLRKAAGNAVQVRTISDGTTDTLTVSPNWDSNPVNGDTFIIIKGFTSGISDRTREDIVGPGTDIYINRAGETIGTHHIDNITIPISFAVTYRNNAYTKRGLSNVNEASTKLGRGFVQVRGQIRVEDDNPYFWKEWTDKDSLQIRIEQTGSVIHDAVTKRARIDIYNAVFDSPTTDDRVSNVTKTWPFWGYLDASEGVPIEFETVNDLAELPSSDTP